MSSSRRKGLFLLFGVTACVFATAVSPQVFAGILEDRLERAESRQKNIKSELNTVDTKQQKLIKAVSTWNRRIATINIPIRELEAEIATLDSQIAHRRQRIADLRIEYRRQKKDIIRLAAERSTAEDRLSERLVQAYMHDNGDVAEWLVGAGSVSEMLARQETVELLYREDQRIVETIEENERKIRVKRARNHVIQRQVKRDIAGIKQDLAKADSARAKLAARRSELEKAKDARQSSLSLLEEKEDHLHEEFDQLSDEEDQLKEAIKTGAMTWTVGIDPSTISSAGLVWPVSGPVVSGFGPRWGRLHAGLDIAVPSGTPIIAAAPGIVTYNTWMSGYGNLVIVQHAGDLSTAYAHQSQIAVSNGQFVSQGQVLGYVGCTGHCFGDHLHFETRMGGSATDPMQFL